MWLPLTGPLGIQKVIVDDVRVAIPFLRESYVPDRAQASQKYHLSKESEDAVRIQFGSGVSEGPVSV